MAIPQSSPVSPRRANSNSLPKSRIIVCVRLMSCRVVSVCVCVCGFCFYRRLFVLSRQATTTAAAVAAQRFERSRSVRNDLALDLPPCLALPDGEERPYGASNRMRIRDYEQVSSFIHSFIH